MLVDDLRIGMYVRCPVEKRGDFEDDLYQYCHDFYMGKVMKITATGKVHVVFYDPAGIRRILSECVKEGEWKASELERVKPMMYTQGLIDKRAITILDAVGSENAGSEFYSYYVRINHSYDKKVVRVREDELILPFNRADYNPLKQIQAYELQAPRWYLQRKIASAFMNTLENVPFGFKNLIGTRVYLLPHQIDTIIRALAEKPCRLMLADEVGLGKTIEALSILKSMQDLSPDMKTIIVVPDTLLYQWQNEISLKCWIDVDVLERYTVRTGTLLLTYDEFKTSCKKNSIPLNKWDLLIVDETHRLLNDAEMYESILMMAQRVRDVLLLSATPILHRGSEYHKLLTLLNPERFENMGASQFQALLDKQRTLQHVVFPLVRDLEDYLEYDEMPDEYVDSLEKINDGLKDDRLAQIILEIDIHSEDHGLRMVKIALAYITEFYQIERGILRHRRRDTVADGIKRTCELLDFDKGNAEFGIFEHECYEKALDLAEDALSSQGNGAVTRIKRLMTAAASSPYALFEVIHDDGWNDERLSYYCKRWMESYEKEIEDMSQVSDEIDRFYSKLSKIIDYIDQEDYEKKDKVLVFTSFTCNIKKMYMGFVNYFGKESTRTFYRDMDAESLQESADAFQEDKNCKFLICDESGGEGRNFQIADYIVHFDLPWSPAVLEQRIGRLDRIGREESRPVKSVVMMPDGTIETQLFEIYRDAFKIFDYSLCGIEIVFEEMQKEIDSALCDDLRYGLSKNKGKFEVLMKETNDEVEDERYFDRGRYALNEQMQSRMDLLIQQFTHDDGKELLDTMMAWTEMAGIGARVEYRYGNQKPPVIGVRTNTENFNLKSMQNALYCPKRMENVVKRAHSNHMFHGTFSREIAVNHENMAFLAPYNPFFDSILDNAMESYRGRSSAMQYRSAPIDWCGLWLTWDVHFNPIKVFEGGWAENLITVVSRYLPLKQFETCMSVTNDSRDISKAMVQDAIQVLREQKKTPQHLGKRGEKEARYRGKKFMIDWFVQTFPLREWLLLTKRAYDSGYKEVVDNLSIEIPYDQAKEDLDNLLVTNEARRRFYGNSGNQTRIISQEMIDALLYGLAHPHISLDSMVLYWLRKEA